MNPVSIVPEVAAQVKCLTCGASNRLGDRFCISCGAALAQSEVAGHRLGEQAVIPPIALPDDVPAEVVALVNTQVLEMQSRLLDRIDLLDRQLADLQMDQVRARKPWWKALKPIVHTSFP